MAQAKRKKILVYASVPTALLALGLFFLPFFVPVWLVRDQLSRTLHQHISLNNTNLSWSGPILLEGVELCATGECPAWLKSAQIQADMGLWRALYQNGDPLCLDVTGAELQLDVSAEGKVVTQFPSGSRGGPLPLVRFRDSTFRILQEGHPPLVIQKLQGSLTPQGNGYDLVFESQDGDWGKPKGKAKLGLDTPFTLDLDLSSTGDIPVTLEKLRSIPFVGAEVWDTVQLNGTTPLDFQLKIQPEGVHYAVQVKPRDTILDIPVIGFHAVQTQGNVQVSPGKVAFQNVSAKAYDGSIALPEGEFFFTEDAKKFKLDLDVQNFSMKALPESWGDRKLFQLLPVNARMSGKAEILISWGVNQPLRLGGGGEGKVRTTVLGITQSEWALHLRPLGNRLLVIPDFTGIGAPFGLIRRRH